MISSNKEINSEEEIIKIIREHELNEVKEIFNRNNIEIKKFNYLKNVVNYLIEENFSFDIIKFIIELQQKHYVKQQQTINNTKLLFHSIECNNYKTAKFLLKNGVQIDNLNTESKNIIEYLIEKRKLDLKNFFYILNIVKNASLIIPEVLCQLIKCKDLKFIKTILYYNYYDIPLILDLLLDYKNRTPLSKRKLQNKIYNLNKGIIKINNKTKTGHYPFIKAIENSNEFTIVKNNGIELVKLFMGYAKKNYIFLDLNEKDVEGYYPLLKAIENNDIEIVKLLMQYANNHHIVLNLNEKLLSPKVTRISEKDHLKLKKKHNYGRYPLLEAVKKNNVEMVNLLMEYASTNGVILELNEKDKYGYYPLLFAIFNNNIEIVELLMAYAKENHIILNLNEKKYCKNFSNLVEMGILNFKEIHSNGTYPLLEAINKNNVEMVKLLLDYASKNDIIIELNEKDEDGDYPLLVAVNKNKFELVKLLVDYANTNHVILKFDEREKRSSNLFKKAIMNNSIKTIKLLLEYANENNILLYINLSYDPLYFTIDKNKVGMAYFIIDYASKHNVILNIPVLGSTGNESIEIAQYIMDYTLINKINLEIPFLLSISNDSIETTQFIMNYANENNIKLNLDGQTRYGWYPFLYAINNDNIEMAQLIIDYASKNRIILDINNKNKKKNYPLLLAVNNNNIEMVQLIMDYANRNHIKLNINDKNVYKCNPFYVSVQNNNIELAQLLFDYCRNNNIKLNINGKNREAWNTFIFAIGQHHRNMK